MCGGASESAGSSQRKSGLGGAFSSRRQQGDSANLYFLLKGVATLKHVGVGVNVLEDACSAGFIL